MSYTKAEVVQSALSDAGLAEFEFDISVEELTSGARKLDTMMAKWSDMGIHLGYNLGGELSDDSGIPDIALDAVSTNLAIRLAASYGKKLSPETKVIAKSALNSLMRYSAHPIEMQLPSMPVGAGYKSTNWTYSGPPEDKELEPVDNSVDLSGGPDA